MAKILLIDDDALVRETVQEILGHAGHEIVAAENGARGMALFRSENPDLVITDILMPQADGIEIISEISKADPHAKIIAMSGAGRLGNINFLALARAMGATRVVPKPFDPDELLACVQECLDEHDCPLAAVARRPLSAVGK